MRVAIVLGTRPEIIKMSPIVRECQSRGVDFIVLHTGQHYSYNMDRAFFEDLGLLEPDYNLEIGSGSHGEQTAGILMGVEKVLEKSSTDFVLVQGDTNSVLAGALAAAKMHIPVGHVEAGLRSYDKRMPEEINRVIADHLSSQLYAPTDVSKGNLLREGISKEIIYVTGNTIVDAVKQNLEISRRKVNSLADLGLREREYVLCTLHRAENVENRETLKDILKGLKGVSEELGLPLVFPIHPRTRKRITEFGIRVEGIHLVEPVGFLEFLQLEAKARLVLTDSGGIQEEACILGVPCVTIRENTERPETLQVGSNSLAGITSEGIITTSREAFMSKVEWKNPYGDGKAAQKILDIIELTYECTSIFQ